MMGRRGNDQFTLALFIVYIVSMLLSRIFYRVPVLPLIIDAVGLAAAIFGVYRAFSRDIPRRERENRWFLTKWAAVRRTATRIPRRIRDRKTHVYIRCKTCSAELRVPRGKGKLIVTCPKCRAEIRITT